MSNIIEVNNLTKRYKKAKTNAVDNISFPVKSGEFFALLGPNGAGKTTTISVLTTTLAKTSGTITIAGHDLDKSPSKVRQEIGVIFQKPSLDENLTAEENVRFHAILYGLYPFRPTFSLMPKEYKAKVKALAEILGIENDLGKPIKALSGGMKRKLEIVRSLIHSPKILFLDEPTSGLDPLSRKSLWSYLQEVRKKENITVFLTTHYLQEAEAADYITIIDKGKIVSKGSPSQTKKDLVEEYIHTKTKQPKKLISELNSNKIKFEQVEDFFKIPLNGKSAQKLIQSIDTKLSDLDIHSPTLEEAYLQIISNNDQRN